jgi:uncharacterized protein YegP (UPF0339 family)
MTFEIYQAWTLKGRRWFWRLRASNGKIIAIGGEGFHNRADVVGIIDRIVQIDAAKLKEKQQ